MTPPTTLVVGLDDAQVSRIAEAVRRELVAEGLGAPAGVLNVAQAATYLGCKPARLYDLVKARRVTHAKEGRRLVFRREWLDALLEVREAV